MMKRIKLFGVIVLVLICCGLSSVAQEADALMKRVVDKLNTVSDYEARGKLKTDIPFIKLPESDVIVYYKRPDKYRIKKQEGISVVPKGGINFNINALLSGKSYTAVGSGTGTVNGKPVSIIKLLPVSDTSDIILSTLYIDEQEALIRRTTTTTRNNGTYDMLFDYGKFARWGLPDKVIFSFSTKDFKLPKGVTLEYETDTKPASTQQAKNQQGKLEINYSEYTINKGISDDLFR
jgi:hypothetical protein